MKEFNRDALIERAENRCEVCYGGLGVMSVHHRRPRSVGGTNVAWINQPPNLLVICGTGTSGCHGLIESYRSRSYEHGWLLHYGWLAEFTPFADLSGNWWLLVGNKKLTITTPFDSPNPSSIQPVGSVGLTNPKKKENDEFIY